MSDAEKTNGWDESKKLVNYELTRLSHSLQRVEERQDERFDTLEKLLADLRVDLAVQKTKIGVLSTFYGVLGGLISTLTFLIVQVLVKR